jgi:hypothetical protein
VATQPGATAVLQVYLPTCEARSTRSSMAIARRWLGSKVWSHQPGLSSAMSRNTSLLSLQCTVPASGPCAI